MSKQILSEERSTGMGATRFVAILTGGDFVKISRLPEARYLGRLAGEQRYAIDGYSDTIWAKFYRSNSGKEQVTVYGGLSDTVMAEFGSFEEAHRWAAAQSAPPPPTIESVLTLAAQLPSGLNDFRAAEKLLAEREELVDALTTLDRVGALTEAADAVYYAVKHLNWVAGQVGTDIDGLFRLAVAKYSLRARPGNPKDDAAERAACVAVMQ